MTKARFGVPNRAGMRSAWLDRETPANSTLRKPFQIWRSTLK
jgi:hypothetical protein